MPITSFEEYELCRDRLSTQLRNWPQGAPVRLAKPTSNVFRHRTPTDVPGLDVSELTGVISVDGINATADVLGMTTYEDLVAATLPHGFMPLVVPQLKTITLGGAVTGLGIESSSFRNGFPHESVIEMDVLTPTGDVVVARNDNEHADLYRGFANSYGTLGYALRLKIRLERTKAFVKVEHIKHSDSKSFFLDMAERCASGDHDFVDGTVFSLDEMYVTVASFEDKAPYTSDYTRMNIYYRSLQTRSVDHLSTLDYLWRWDTDWFWCSGNFGMQKPLVRRLVPSRYRRSDVYWKLRAWDAKRGFSKRVRSAMKLKTQEAVIQDVEVSIDESPEMLAFLDREIDLKPVWVCPIKLLSPDNQWDLYTLDSDKLYVNFGFWGAVDLEPGEAPDVHNRMIEDEVSRLGGRKSLYSTAFYDEDDFWSQYNGNDYRQLKSKYDPNSRFLDLYAKAVKNR